MKSALAKLITGAHLTEEEAENAMTALAEGGVPPAQIGAFLAALRVKGETVGEITGFARALRQKSVLVQTSRRPLLDTCGTGGDSVKTFNISTTAAFVASACGVAVAKHGNRAVTSKCGSADVLESLGVRLVEDAVAVGRCIDRIGIGFLFARAHHPAMRHAASVRAELGFRTVFNALGPLTNPAGATRQLLGVYDPALCEPLARVLGNLGAERAMVVHGGDGRGGLDEIATWGETVVAEWDGAAVNTYTVTPEMLGVPVCDPADLRAGCDPGENAAILRGILSGADTGARRDIVAANAGAALYVAGVAESVRDGVRTALQALASGAGHAKLEELITETNR
ncbi:MAG: anthranilate phosphoribosyltransferase [Armatimonadetes bacterium]|nr:anthranilate phosphoribosyltransferase [Armatimonadota bacterium]